MKKLLLVLTGIILSSAIHAQGKCDSVSVINVEYHPFYDSVITVTTLTKPNVFIGYPTFTMFDFKGDTIAVEDNQRFGITGLSANTMKLRPGQPGGNKFSGYIGLQGYVSAPGDVSCFYEQQFDLCPDTCRTIYPAIANWGNANATGTLTWSILENEKIVASGQWELTDQEQLDHDTLCLNPGRYTLTVKGLLTGGGQWHVWLYSTEPSAAEAAIPYQPGEVLEHEFAFFKNCSLPTGIEYKQGKSKKTHDIYSYGNDIHIAATAGNEIGNTTVYDVSGRIIYSSFIAKAETTVSLPQVQPGIFIVRISNAAGQAYSKIALGF